MPIKVSWAGGMLCLTQPTSPDALYPQLDRGCEKLRRAGFEIRRTGKGNLRYAIPTAKLKGKHPSDTFTPGQVVEWEV